MIEPSKTIEHSHDSAANGGLLALISISHGASFAAAVRLLSAPIDRASLLLGKLNGALPITKNMMNGLLEAGAPRVATEIAMLEMRPNCECCDKDLPPESADARICSFECTFCAACAEGTLQGRCPNCGGELAARPSRTGNSLSLHPASTQRVHSRAAKCTGAISRAGLPSGLPVS